MHVYNAYKQQLLSFFRTLNENPRGVGTLQKQSSSMIRLKDEITAIIIRTKKCVIQFNWDIRNGVS
jgi:hypothetical protein